jgi:hypothetical protein
MSKQIKLGFDKIASIPISEYQQLVDIRGNPLEDKDGKALYTETLGTPSNFFTQRNATSLHINNTGTSTVTDGGSISIRELFPELSEVSSSILGIPRAETQQTLLANVSIYGQDEDTWEFYRSPASFQPPEWVTRRNRRYGNRYESRLGEYAQEQALSIEAFPTPWSFPFGPRWATRYNAAQFPQYSKFIDLGNALYVYYSSRNQKVFAETHFLVPGMAVSEGNDVIYNENFALAMEYVEQWTITWMDIRDNKLEDPLKPGRLLNAADVNTLFFGIGGILGTNDTFTNTRPGYSSTNYRYCQLQSKESFRYQPGAISGFTFGVKLNADPTRAENVLEWGCANETDQLMFQLRGEKFSIVRRSTVPLTLKSLELAGFEQTDQKTGDSIAPNPFERPSNEITTTDIGLVPVPSAPLYELVIPQDNFNGDPLNGTGLSGYNISFSDVTMYKIEYSWYGAIGAKFYAYVPVGNDDARWVLMHTLIIENTLDKPALQNPFMHFRYSIYMSDTSALQAPMFLYKYGASYYIDGSDKGTFGYNSYKTPGLKSITSANSKTLLGFYPKDEILNRDGIGVSNQKNFFIESMSISSDKNARVDFLECEGCPGGHGYFYATSIQNGQRSNTDDTYRITSTGGLEFVDDAGGTKVFTDQYDGKKIIGPGVFSAYVYYDPANNNELSIRRRMGTDRINSPINDITFSQDDKTIINGVETPMLEYEFDGRLTGYDDIIASSTVITKSKIKVQFLNPIKLEQTGQFAEFRIGITSKKPEVSTEGELLFDEYALSIEDEIYAEFSQFQASKNIQGADVGEVDPRYGSIMSQDPRIRRPAGVSSGDCSELNFEISDKIVTNVSYSTTNPDGGGSGNFIIFSSEPEIANVDGGNIGIFDGNRFIDSGISFTSNYVPFEIDNTTIYVAAISDPIPGYANIGENGIALRVIKCFGRYINITKVFPFSANEYYLFIAMRDNARINNIVVREFDEQSSFAHTPDWIKGDDCLIEISDLQSPAPSSEVIEKLNNNEYIGTDGRFNMGGLTFTGNIPANFKERGSLNSVKFDDQLSLPLRPSFIKTSFFVGANKTETINTSHIFDTDKYKISKGSFNNKYYYLSSVVTDSANTGSIQINVSGKEQ